MYDEAATVASALPAMAQAARRSGVPFEVLVCENGSRDDTLAIVRELAERHDGIRVETLPVADYGRTLRHAIEVAQYEKIVIFNVDFWSTEFLEAALAALDGNDMILGSKVLGRDRRPIIRRLITRSFNRFLRLRFGFRGTDTHGMKALRRTTAGRLAADCVSKGWLFDTELVLRAERAGLKIVEQPVDTAEIRAPSYGALVSRIPDVLRNVARMQKALRALPPRPSSMRKPS